MARTGRGRFPEPTMITDTAALAAAVERLRGERFVTVDTEFVRERTYFPELCVVQLGGADAVFVVDTLADGLELDALGPLLDDPDVVKVFHAARQDLEIFLHRFGRLPARVFDTQVAAMVAGFGDQVGYDSLVASVTGGQIDKAHRFSDWSRRPLSAAQVTYAAADVTHLREVYVRLGEKLDADGRLDWVGEEMAELHAPETFRPDPDTLWERMRPRTNNRRMLGVLRAAAAWREREAQRLDLPRQRLVRDESLLEVAAVMPRDVDALAAVRGVSRGFAEGKGGAGLIEAVAGALALPEAELPAAPGRNGPKPSPALVALLKVLLQAKSEQHDVAPRLLASGDDIDRLATEEEPDVPALAGWRREVFGEDALSLKAGRISLGVQGKRVRLLRT